MEEYCSWRQLHEALHEEDMSLIGGKGGLYTKGGASISSGISSSTSSRLVSFMRGATVSRLVSFMRCGVDRRSI